MRTCTIIFAFLFVFISSVAVAQLAGGITSESWLDLVASNAVKKGNAPGVFSAAPAGLALYFAQSGSIRQPYLVCVPVGYNPSRPTSVVVFLHGAILVKDSFQYKEPSNAREPIFSIADTLNTIVVFPFARKDLKWQGQLPAYENIINIIHQVERDYNVDKKKVYIGGISMGAMATFWFLNNRPDLFAGFYAFSAAPHSDDGDIKYGNITSSRPLFSVNAKDDRIFSYTDMEKAYTEHKNEAPGWHYSTVETGGHRFIYGPDGKAQVKSLLSKLLR